MPSNSGSEDKSLAGLGASELLHAVAAISNQMGEHKTAAEAIRQLVTMIGPEFCAVSEWNKTDKHLTRLAKYRNGEFLDPRRDDTFLIDTVPLFNIALDNPNPTQVTINDQEITAEGKEYLDQTGLKSILLLPLISQEEVIGLIEICSQAKAQKFNDGDIIQLQLFANHTGIALERAVLLSEANRRAAELESLREASLALTASLDREEVLDAILSSALHLSQEALDAHVFLYDSGQDEITFGAALWADGKKNTVWSSPRKEGLTYKVARSGKIVTVPNLLDHELYQGVDLDKNGWSGAIIGLPLHSGEKVVGVMNVAYAIPREFSETDLRILQLLADQAALAIRNSDLHDLAIQEALTDPLTLINNRRAYERRLDEEYRRSSRYKRPFVLMLLDLNNFKQVNDAHGHAVGDAALQGIARCIKRNIRDTDFIARIGGDEFVLILPESDERDASEIKAKLEIAMLKCSCEDADCFQPYGITLSIGYALYPDQASDGEQLYKIADKFLYASKKENKVDRV